MATVFVNGCFDLLHDGHKKFLTEAKCLGVGRADFYATTVYNHLTRNRLVVAVNSDESAQRLKAAKWGSKYPVYDLQTRIQKLRPYSDEVIPFWTEDELLKLIKKHLPCIICKGPDYADRIHEVTGSAIAPVLILDTPETEEIRQLKRKAYQL